MSKRKILLAALSLCMVAILAIGGSLAYLTDTDNAINVFTVGKVTIVQNEEDRNGNVYGETPKKMYPIVDDKVVDGFHMGQNYIDKIVTVTNTGSENAFVRTFIAVPAALDDGPTTYDAMANVMHWNFGYDKSTSAAGNLHADNQWFWGKSLSADAYPGKGGAWNGYQMTKDGVLYNVYIATHAAAIAKDEETAPTLIGVYFDKSLDFDDAQDSYYVIKYNEDGTPVIDEETGLPEKIYFDMPENTAGEYTWNVLVATQAVQEQGFTDPYDALAHAFGTPGVAQTSIVPAFDCPFDGELVRVF